MKTLLSGFAIALAIMNSAGNVYAANKTRDLGEKTEVSMACSLGVQVVLQDLRGRIKVPDFPAHMLKNHRSILCFMREGKVYLHVTPPSSSYVGGSFAYILSAQTYDIEFFREGR